MAEADDLDWKQALPPEVELVDITDGNLDRQDDEVEDLKRFVQGVKEPSWSSMWRDPTGLITDLDLRSRVVTTNRTSLPL